VRLRDQAILPVFPGQIEEISAFRGAFIVCWQVESAGPGGGTRRGRFGRWSSVRVCCMRWRVHICCFAEIGGDLAKFLGRVDDPAKMYAISGKFGGDGGADAFAGAGYKCDFPIESELHPPLPSFCPTGFTQVRIDSPEFWTVIL
jgi:hypothetical protein